MNAVRLRAIRAAGGLAGTAAPRFETPAHGRIHEVHIVRKLPPELSGDSV